MKNKSKNNEYSWIATNMKVLSNDLGCLKIIMRNNFLKRKEIQIK